MSDSERDSDASLAAGDGLVEEADLAEDSGRPENVPAGERQGERDSDEGSRADDDADEDSPAEILEDLLAEIADGLDLDVEIEVDESEGVLRGCLRGEDVGLFIGRRGQTIDAVQHLAQRIVFHDGPSDVRVVIDADGYRERRAETLRADADDADEESLRTGRPVELDPMPASERRVVHEHLRDRGDIQTHSEGDEPERRLVVSPLEN